VPAAKRSDIEEKTLSGQEPGNNEARDPERGSSGKADKVKSVGDEAESLVLADHHEQRGRGSV
jgi:hypothetical protein